MNDVRLDCPVCGEPLSDTNSLVLRGPRDPEEHRTIEHGRCLECNVRVHRIQGDQRFYWSPICGECNQSMVPAGAGPKPGRTLLFQCRNHPAKTYTHDTANPLLV